MKFVIEVLAAVVIFVLGVLAFVYSGTYNVAATSPDSKIVQWLLSTTMDRSVAMHADRSTAAPDLSDEQAREGFRVYNQTCIICHGAPGKDPGDIGKGLNPEPPYLPDTAGEWNSAQLFWIIKNGIKMTGMPAFGPAHDDTEIWNLVAFVQKLPKMTPEQYSQMEQNPVSR
jgi:mono/diheme cytochrome c family protein